MSRKSELVVGWVMIGIVGVVLFALFGWIGLLGGFVVLIWLAKRSSSKSQAPADLEFFVERDQRGNRFMIHDPLDAPTSATNSEREALMQLCVPHRQLNSEMIALRHQVRTNPEYLKTQAGINLMNELGSGSYLLVGDRVTNWQTNDFRKFGIEFLAA